MHVSAIVQTAGISDADTVAVGVFGGEAPPADTPAELGDLIASGEARRAFKSLAQTHADGKRWLIVGLGRGEDLTAERARVAASVARSRAHEFSTRTLCWVVPDGCEPAVAGALVEGTLL